MKKYFTEYFHLSIHNVLRTKVSFRYLYYLEDNLENGYTEKYYIQINVTI